MSNQEIMELEDRIDELENEVEYLEERNEIHLERIAQLECKLEECEDHKTITINIAEKLGISPHSTDFKFYPEVVIWSKIEELQNAQTTKQA